MSINISLVDFLNLFSMQEQYSVPKWQRRYSWDKSTIEELVKDLEAIAKNKSENAMHFGGTLITYSEPTPVGTPRVNNVVDGQQRLTTISILLVCIAEKLEEIGSSTGGWTPETIRSVLLRNNIGSPEKLRLQDRDNEEYKRILNGYPEGEGKVSAAWEVLRKAVDELDPRLLMEGLSRFKVISFPCQSSNDPQQIFESLNATGVRLTEGEKVKNWLLMGLDRTTQETVYKDYWCRLESSLDAVSEPKRIDDFLWNFLRWKTGENCGISYTYSNLRRWWYEYGEDNRMYLCKDLAELAALYGKITGVNDRHTSDEIDKLLRHLQYLGINTHRPFTLRLFDDATRPNDTGAHESELIKVLGALSTWLTRIWLSGKSTSALNTSIIGLAHNRGPQPSESYSDYWIKKIQGFRNSGIAVPNKEEIKEGIKRRKAYGGKASDAAKTILWVMNSGLGNPASPRIEDLSLEHVMPKRLSEEWQEYLGDDIDELQRDYTNSLANLTLVGKEFNSEISNRSYAEKRELYRQSSVMLTRKLAVSYVDWRKEDMDDRVGKLTSSVLACWPWEDVSRAKVRWRIDGGDWQKEKSYAGMLPNIVAVLLDTDLEGYSERLLGYRANKDFFRSGTEPTSSGRRFKEIPGYSQYVVNVNYSARNIANLCVEMGRRCGVEVDIEHF